MSRVPYRASHLNAVRALPVVAGAAFLLGALVAPVTVKAEEILRITVLPFTPIHGDLPQATGTRTAEFIEKELGEYKDFEIVRPKATAKAAAAKKPGEVEAVAAKRAVDAAMTQFDRGDQLADSRRVKLSSDAYDRGVQQFLAGFQEAPNFEPLLDAYVKQAIARFKLGREADAVRALEDFVRLAPGRPLENVPDVVANLHQKATTTVYEKGFGRIRVTSVPSGATVHLNGVEIGNTPLVARDVLTGEHYVKVSIPGEGTVAQRVRIASDTEAEINARLVVEETGPAATLAKAIANNRIDDEAIAAAKQLGTSANAQVVLFGGVHGARGDEIAVRSYFLQMKDSRLVGLGQISFDSGMLGAPIQVLNLVNDLSENLIEPPETLALPLVVAGGIPAPAANDTPREIRIAPAAGQLAQADGGRRGARGPVRTEERRVVTGARPVEQAPAVQQEEAPKRRTTLRQRGRIGAEPEVVEEAPPESAYANADLNAPVRRSDSVTSLTPEQLRALELGEEKKGPNYGKIALWTGVGVVGAAAIGGLVYFLATPPEASSATAVINWQAP